jgi:hypothetical protein
LVGAVKRAMVSAVALMVERCVAAGVAAIAEIPPRRVAGFSTPTLRRRSPVAYAE